MLWPVALVVLSTVLYHVAQKSIPATAPPVASLAVSYGVALLGTLALLPFFPFRMPASRGFRELNWASVAIGITIVGVELGFLLAYRAGWRVSVGSAVTNAAVAALLVPVGLLLFHERLSGVNALGLLLCVAGVVLAVAR
jgi:multidrug transporter EmrE-like cation transporter